MLNHPTDFPVTQNTFSKRHPKTLQKRPISWFPGVGFYRNRSMAEQFTPKTAGSTSTQYALTPLDAFRLGLGRGLGGHLDHGHPIVDAAVGFCADRDCDLELMARLGLTARLLPDLCRNEPEIHERIARHMCGVLGRAVPKGNKWHGVLLRFSEGSERKSDHSMVENTMYTDGQPFNYTAVVIAEDTARDHTVRYFGGLKRFDGSIHRVPKSVRRRMLAETVEMFEQIAIEQGVGHAAAA